MIMMLLHFDWAKSETLVTADYEGSGWEDSNPSNFKMTIVKTVKGEYQITNGYGPNRAPQVMQVGGLICSTNHIILRYAC
jgi:hypothetical protein